MHGVAVDSYCEQYRHKYRMLFYATFQLIHNPLFNILDDGL